MYQIKQLPEDFIVKEISNVKMENNGGYTYFLLKKKNYTTLKALEKIAEKLRVPLKALGFAGNKDKNAVTEQVCSVRGRNNIDLERIRLKDIWVEYLGKWDIPVSLGDLAGNEFEITVRNIDKSPKAKRKFVNYFGEQRFSKNNAEIGKAIIKRDFKGAVELLLQGKGDIERKVRDVLIKNPNNYVLALKAIPKKILKIYLHSYQAYLWNKTAELYAKEKKSIKIPLVGFGTEADNGVIKKIMEEEAISQRDFIIREIPEISSEGTCRKLFAEVHDLEIGELKMDELNKEKSKVKLKFRLDKGCYATEFVRQLFS